MTPDAPLWKRLTWMAGLWVASVMVLGLLSGIIKLALSG